MTVREALREPITLQSLICLCAGVFIGVASCVIPTWLTVEFGPKLECHVVPPAR